MSIENLAPHNYNSIPTIVIKLNELIDGFNRLEAEYQGHYHTAPDGVPIIYNDEFFFISSPPMQKKE